MHLSDAVQLSDWLRRFGGLAVSREVLETLLLQLAVIIAAFLLAWGFRAATRSWSDRLAQRVATRFRSLRIPAELHGLVIFCYAWLVLAVAERGIAELGGERRLVGIAASLTGLWIVLRASALLLRDALLARAVATVAWVVFALNILGLLAPTETALDDLAVTIGTLRLSVFLVLKGVVIVAILLWIAHGLARVIGTRLQRVAALSPSVQVLSANLIRIALVSVALLIGLNAVGIDLTAFAVFSGAVGALDKTGGRDRSRQHLRLGRLSRRTLRVGTRPGGQGISDSERKPHHQRGDQLVVFEPPGAARCEVRRGLRQ